MKHSTFLSSLTRIEQAEDFPELIEAFTPVREHFGLASFLCVRLTSIRGTPGYPGSSLRLQYLNEQRILTSRPPQNVLIAATVNPEWMKVYTENNFVTMDPVLWHSMYCTAPFCWDLSFRHPALAEAPQQRVLAQAEAFGILGGMIWPIHEPGNRFGIVSCFATGTGRRLRSRLAEDGDTLISLLVTRLYHRCQQLRDRLQPPAPGISLSTREKQVMHWLAQGKNVWEIGRILGIKERTVRFHLARIEQRMGVAERHQAIARFIEQEWTASLENSVPALQPSDEPADSPESGDHETARDTGPSPLILS